MTKNKGAPGPTGAQHIPNLQGLNGNSEATRNAASRKGWRSNPSAPADWQSRLPDPTAYYSQHLAKLSRPNAEGWAQARCPFHDDRDASLSVHLGSPKGGWKCFAACGSGDLVSFHMRVAGLDFVKARAELTRGGR